MAKDQLTPAQVKERLDELALQTAELNLDEASERAATRQAQRESRVRTNRQRQAQLVKDNEEKRVKIKACTHRQGGSIKQPNRGKGPSALRSIYLPEEGRMLIMCANCPLRVFSPPEIDASPKQRRQESEAKAEARVDRYEREKDEFERLWEASQDQLTDEAAQPMDCGTTFTFTDRERNRVHVPSPCDSYAQGRDNRKGRAA